MKKITNINCVFTFNWANDIDNDGYHFSDFHGIKKEFKNKEKICIAAIFYLDNSHEYELEINIFNNNDGSELFNSSKKMKGAGSMVHSWILPDSLKKEGDYFFTIQLKQSPDSGSIIESDNFRILN